MKLKHIRYNSILIVLITTMIGCASKDSIESVETGKRTLTIDFTQPKQTIRNFGASDAWVCQYVGGWPDQKRDQVADWLFSMETDPTGKPKGIGLSLWRFNIGAGSVAQSNISDEWRSTEGFLKNDLTYDWTKQAGQRWFMQAAKARGVEYFLGFTNSPPIQLTKNGKAFTSNPGETNIQPANYLAFAKFLVNVSSQFKQDGIPLTYLSPFNEPQWDWNGNGQEGAPYKNAEMYAITKVIDSLLTVEGLDTRIQLVEAAKLNFLFSGKADKGNQVYAFFNQQSPLYLGNRPHVDHIISGHSYFSTTPVDTLKQVRTRVWNAVQSASVPLEFWQSEYCILGDQEEVKPSGKDTGIIPALYVARIIHHDLNFANASAWHWWLSLSAYDYKDGLIYVDKNKTDGAIEDSKTMWALGNFSRFIRPGSKRIEVTGNNFDIHNPKALMVSAYVNEQSKQAITVIINSSFTDSSFAIDTKGGEVETWQPYITSDKTEDELKPLSPITAGEIIIPKQSIVTLVGTIQ